MINRNSWQEVILPTLAAITKWTITIAIIGIALKGFGLPGISVLFVTLVIIHLWYRWRYGKWMD